MPDYDFSAIEQQYGLPQGYLARVRELESSNGTNTYNPNSGAAGDFQFIPRTARQYGLTNPYDTMAAADAAGRLGRDNMAALVSGGVADPTGAHLYLAHQQGATGALKLLNGGGPAGGLVGNNAVAWNGGSPSMPGSAFAQKWMDKFNVGFRPQVPTNTPMPFATGNEYAGVMPTAQAPAPIAAPAPPMSLAPPSSPMQARQQGGMSPMAGMAMLNGAFRPPDPVSAPRRMPDFSQLRSLLNQTPLRGSSYF